MSFSNSFLLIDSGSFSIRISSAAAFFEMLISSLTDFWIVWGVIPCSSLYFIWISRLRSVSSMAFRIDSVTVSAYIITWPCAFRAARPIVWIREVSERRNPSLSASRIATNVISGISRPSLKRLIPTSTSNTSRRISRIISERSRVSTSEWRYFTLIPTSRI